MYALKLRGAGGLPDTDPESLTAPPGDDDKNDEGEILCPGTVTSQDFCFSCCDSDEMALGTA